jgi:hypothetical protein
MRLQVRITRQAISPRLAIRIFEKGGAGATAFDFAAVLFLVRTACRSLHSDDPTRRANEAAGAVDSQMPPDSSFSTGRQLAEPPPRGLKTSSPWPLEAIPWMAYIPSVAWVVEYTDEFGAWWDTLTVAQHEDIVAHVGELERRGPSLPYPYSSAVATSRHGHMRELRVQSRGGQSVYSTPLIHGARRSC